MMSETDSELEAFSADEYTTDRIDVSGQPALGDVVEIQYDSRAGGAFASANLSTIRGELLFTRDGLDDALGFGIHDSDGGRVVFFELDPETLTVEARSLAARQSNRGQRIGEVASVEFTDESVNNLAAATSTLRAVKSGDAVEVDGTEYGVVEVSEYGPSKRPQRFSAVLTRPDTSEYVLKTWVQSGDVEFSERHGDGELEIDTSDVSVSRFRERFHGNDDIQTEDTTDLFPAPHGAREGERLTFTLSREDGEDERVSGRVTDVRYFKQMGRASILSKPEEQDPRTEVQLDDGRSVNLRSYYRGRRGSPWTPAQMEQYDNGVIRAHVVDRSGEDSEHEHITAVDVQPESEGADSDDGGDSADGDATEDGEPMTDGGEDDAPTVAIPGEESNADYYHGIASPCRFQLADSKEVSVNRAVERGYDRCPSCKPPEPTREIRADGGQSLESLGQDVGDALAESDIPLNAVSVSVTPEGSDVTVQANGHATRDEWDDLRDRITAVLDEHGFKYDAEPQWAFVSVTGREVRTDGGVAATDGGDAGADEPPSESRDPHSDVKRKVIQADPVLMASSVGEADRFLAIWKETDASETELEQYRLVMELAEYREVDPFTTLDDDPGGVSGEGVSVDVWERTDARADGGTVAGDRRAYLEMRVKWALNEFGLSHSVGVERRESAIRVTYEGQIRDWIMNALDEHSLEHVPGRQVILGPGDVYGDVFVPVAANRGGVHE